MDVIRFGRKPTMLSLLQASFARTFHREPRLGTAVSRCRWHGFGIRRYVAAAILGIVCVFTGSPEAVAATFTWDGGGTTDNWGDAINWNSAISSGNALTFAGAVRLTPNNDQVSFSVTSLTFSSGAGAFVLGGNAFNISTAMTNSDADTQTINNNLTISAAQSWAATAGNIIINGSLGLANNATARTLTISGNTSGVGVTINGNITNGGTASGSSITKSNAGFLTLAGNNSYSGTTTLSAGTLNINSATALGTSAVTYSGGTIDNTSGGAITLSNTNNVTMGGNLIFGVSGGTTNDLNLGAGTFSLGGITRTFTINNSATLTIAGVVDDGGGTRGITKAGNGTLELTGANTYTGVTTINAGTLSATNFQAGGTASSIGDATTTSTNLIINAGTLKYTGDGTAGQGATTNRLFQIGNTAAGDTGTLDASGTTAVSFTNTGNITYGTTNQTRNLVLTGTNTGDNTLRPNILDNGTGATAVTKNGVGTWLLSGSNTYTGATTINAGTLKLGSVTALGSATGATTVNSTGALDLNGFTLTNAESTFTINGTGVSSAGALTNSGSAATYSGQVTLGSAATIGGSGNITLSNATPLSGNFLLTKAGSGNLTLNNSSGTRTGGLKVDAGTVTFGNNTAIGATSQTITLNGGTLSLASASAVSTYPVSVTASSSINAGRSTAGTDLGHSFGTLAISNGSTLTINPGTNLNSNVNYGVTFGATTLNSAATLSVANNGSGTGSLNLASITSANYGLTITGGGNVVVTGDIANGTGTLIKQGSGTFTFAGAINGTTGTVGDTTLNAGAITVGNGTQTTTLNTGALAADAGTTLTIATGGTVVANYASGSTIFAGSMAGNGTFQKTGAGTLVLDNTFTASNLTLTLNGGTLSLLGAQITVGTLRITGDTILDFNNSAGTFLSSANVIIDAGVTVTVNNWVGVANNAAQSTIWYATSNLTVAGSGQTAGTAVNQVSFPGVPGLTPTWTANNAGGWFDHEIRPTPEPATYGAIFLSGCLALLGWRRWKFRQA